MEPSSYQILPKLTKEQYESLKADIAARGILVPVEVDEQGNVLDGHHRLQAARELGIGQDAIPTRVRPGLSEEAKIEHVLRLNLLRRQLSRSERRKLAVELRRRGWTQERIAGALGVHVATVSRWLGDVLQMQNVDAESGSTVLPATVLDRRGRRQPATKARRKGDKPEPQEGQQAVRDPEAEASTTGPAVRSGAASSDLVEAKPEVVTLGPAEGSSPVKSSLLPRPEPKGAWEAASAEADTTSSADGGAMQRVLAYLRSCQPTRFAEPGPLDAEEYDRALSFETVLCLLRRLQTGEAAEVLGPWRRWQEHHGNPRAGEETAELLVNLARSLRPRRRSRRPRHRTPA